MHSRNQAAEVLVGWMCSEGGREEKWGSVAGSKAALPTAEMEEVLEAQLEEGSWKPGFGHVEFKRLMAQLGGTACQTASF